jgi:hypothetical protein
MDIVPQLDPKNNNTRWSKSSEGRLQKLPNYKERRLLASILPLVDINGSVKKLTLFLPGLTLLQSPRTNSSVAWLDILRPGTRHCRIWRTSTPFPKTSHPSDVSKKTHKSALPNQHWQLINFTPASSTTTIKISMDTRVKENEDINNYDQPWP